MTARRQRLSPRGPAPPRARPAEHPLRRGYVEAGLGAVAGSVVGGWLGEWIGSRLAEGGSPDELNPAPLFVGIAGGLWLGAILGATVALLVMRRRLAWPTGAALILAWPALASAIGVLQTLLGMGPSFLPYVVSTLLAGLAARLVVRRVFLGEDEVAGVGAGRARAAADRARRDPGHSR